MNAPKRQRLSGRWKPNGRRAVVAEIGEEYLVLIQKGGQVIMTILGSKTFILAQLYVRGLDRSALWVPGDSRRYIERKMKGATGRLVRETA